MNNILIVEDNVLNLRLFSDVLKSQGFNVWTACDSVSMWNLLLNGKVPDLILMDIQLPSVSGIDLLRQIRLDKKYDTIVIGAISAFAMKTEEQAILKEGFDFFLSKPVDIHRLIEMVFLFLKIKK